MIVINIHLDLDGYSLGQICEFFRDGVISEAELRYELNARGFDDFKQNMIVSGNSQLKAG